VAVINFFNEHAHEIEVYIVPVALVFAWLVSELLHRSRPQPAPAGGAQASRLQLLVHSTLGHASRGLEFVFQKAAPFATGALLALSFFTFGGVVVGNDQSYRATVAMLNANSEMRGNIHNLPEAIAARTRQIEVLTELFRDDDASSADPKRAATPDDD
jgi:hypothetical protein